jgi:trafficking protein particle complex subunit 8
MSDKGKVTEGQVEDLWLDKYIDLDTRNLIDVQVAMADPSAKKIRGKAFSQQDRQRMYGHMRKVVEGHLLQFIRTRIRTLEETVAKTRKGFKNAFAGLFKKAERGENDGLKDGFRMNKGDLELRNLCDLAFVFQDYETALQNASYPLKDFRGCKAFRFAASCLEV